MYLRGVSAESLTNVYQNRANRPPRDRSQDGKYQDGGPVKETGIIRRVSRSKVVLGLYPEFTDTLGTFHDAVFRKGLKQRLVHSIQR